MSHGSRYFWVCLRHEGHGSRIAAHGATLLTPVSLYRARKKKKEKRSK
jgi:hypothetical protein